MAEAGFKRRTEARESAGYREIIKARAGEREEIHRKTFTKWINAQLAKAVPPTEIKDLVHDLQDGHVLLSLLEVLLGTRMRREKGKMRLHKLNNVHTALEMLDKNGVKIVGINQYDIVDGKTTPILGLIWSVILRFQVHDIMHDPDTQQSKKGPQSYEVEKKLLNWCENVMEGYEDVVKLKDFTTSWRDGLGFNAIVHSHRPELFIFDDLLRNDNRTNLEHAFTAAEAEFSVARLLDPADVDVPKPDKKLIIMYLASLYHGLQGYKPQGRFKRRKLDQLDDLREYRLALDEVNVYVARTESAISSRLDTTGRFDNPVEDLKVSEELIEDLSSHKDDVRGVVDKGHAIIDSGRVDKAQCAEVKNELVVLHERWEKLDLMAMRFNKRCRGALVSPLEQQMLSLLEWIRKERKEVATRGQIKNPAVAKKELQGHQQTMHDLEDKQNDIDKTVKGVNDLCAYGSVDEDDAMMLEDTLQELHKEWNDLRSEAFEKQMELQNLSAEGSVGPVEPPPIIQAAQTETVESVPDVGYPDASDENREEEKETKLRQVKEKREAIIDVILACSLKLHHVKAKGSPEDHDQLKEQQYTVEECSQDLKAADPLLKDALLFGREMMNDDLFDEEEKDQISRGLASLQEEYDKVKDDIDDEQERLRALEKENARKEKMHEWKKTRDKLNALHRGIKGKFKKLEEQNLPKEPKDVEERHKMTKECSDVVADCVPELQAGFTFGEKLIGDDQLSNDDKDLIRKDVQEIGDGFKNLKLAIENHQNMLYQLDEQNSRKIEKLEQWTVKKDTVYIILIRIRVKLDEEKSKPTPTDHKELEDRADQVKECHEALQQSEPEIQGALQYGQHLQKDDLLDDDDKDMLEKEVDQLEQEHKSLQDSTQEEMDRLDALSAQLSLGEEKLAEWEHRTSAVHRGLDGASTKLEQNENPENLEDVQHKLQTVKELKSGFGRMEPVFTSTIQFGNELASDDSISENRRNEVKGDVDLLQGRWDTFLSELDNEEARLEDLLNRFHDRDEDLASWHERCDVVHLWVQKKLAGLQERPLSPESSFGVMKRQKSVTEVVVQELMKKEMEVNEIIDEGNSLVDDNSLPREARLEVHHKTRILHDDWQLLCVKVNFRQESIQQTIVELEQRHNDLLDSWRKKVNPLMLWISQAQNKLNTQFAIAPDLDSVKKQKVELKAFMDEVVSREPDVNSALDMGDKILKDPELKEEDRSAVQKEQLDLKHRWQELQEVVIWKRDKIDDTISELEAQQRDKLKKWKGGLGEVNDWVEETRPKIEREPQLAQHVEGALEQVNAFQDIIKDAPVFQEKVTDLNEFSSNLVADPCLGEEERQRVRQEMDECNDNWNALVNMANARNVRLEDNLNILEHQQTDSMEKWTISSGRANLALDKLEVQRSVLDDPLETSLEGVKKQQEALGEFVKEVDDQAPQMAETFSVGESITKDKNISTNKRDEVNGELTLLINRWDRIQDYVALRKVRLDDKERRLARSKQEMTVWGNQAILIQEKIAKLEKICDQPLGPDLDSVDKQRVEVKAGINQASALDPKVQEFLYSSSKLQDDSNHSEEDCQAVKQEASSIKLRWRKLKGDLSSREAKVDKLYDELMERQKRLLSDWTSRARSVSQWLGDTSDRMQVLETPAQDVEHLKTQTQEIEDLREEIEQYESRINSLSEFGDTVINDRSIREPERSLVLNEKEALVARWQNLKLTAASVQDRLLEELKRLEEEEEQRRRAEADAVIVVDSSLVESAPPELPDLVGPWRRDYDDVQEWLDNNEPKLEKEPDSADISELKEQQRDIKEIERELHVYEPRYQNVEDTFYSITDDPNVTEDEKQSVTEDMDDLKDGWDTFMIKLKGKDNRLSVKILDEQERKAKELATCSANLQAVRDWIEDKEGELDSFDQTSDVMETLIEERERLKLLFKSVTDYEPTFVGATDGAYHVIKDPVTTPEDKMRLQSEAHDCQELWDGLNDKIKQRVDSVLIKIQEHQKRQKGLLDEWKEKSSKFAKSLNKSEDKLQDQAAAEKEIDLELTAGLEVPPDVKEKVQKNENITWPPSVNSANERLKRERERLQLIQKEKKNRKWSILEALKDVIASISSRFRREAKPGVNLDKLIEQMINHEDLMAQVSAKQPSADDVMSVGDQALRSGLLDAEQTKKIHDGMHGLNGRWNTLNVDVIEKEMRLEGMAHEITGDYTKFDEWQDECDIMNQGLTQSEAVIKNQKAIGNDIDTLEGQLDENEVIMERLKENQPRVDAFCNASKELVEGGRLDKADLDGVDKTKNALVQRWDAVNNHLKERQEKLEDKLDTLEAEQKAQEAAEEEQKKREEDERKRREEEERAKAEGEGRERTITWRNGLDEVDLWLKKGEPTLQRETDDEDLKGLKEQQRQIREIDMELPIYEEKFHNVESVCDVIQDDPYINDGDKETVAEDTAGLKGRWKTFIVALDDKRDRLDNKIKTEENKRANAVAECRANLNEVKDWIEIRETELESIDPAVDDVKAAMEQRAKLKDFSKLVVDYDPTFVTATEGAYKLIKDPVITPDEKLTLQTEAQDCEERWERLNDNIKLRVDRTLDLQNKQRSLLEEWKDKFGKFEKSLKKSEEKLQQRIPAESEIGVEFIVRPEVPSEVKQKVDQNETISWQPSTVEANERLKRERQRLQDILIGKKNRKWTILESLKDVMASISSRFRREAKSGLNLEKLVVQMKDHEDLLEEVAAEQPSAEDVMSVGDQALRSGLLDAEQTKKIHDGMHGLNGRWNTLNIDVIEKEMRLEGLALDIADEYTKFDEWRDNCDNVSEFLLEAERLIKTEEKISDDIDTVKEQLDDNTDFATEVEAYSNKVSRVFEDGRALIDGGQLDKMDVEGIEKTTNVLTQRWNAVDDHLKERREKLLQKLKALEQADRDRQDERTRREQDEEDRRLRDEEERRRRKEEEERAKGEAAGRELLINWRNERNDVELWLEKEEPKLQQEADDLDLIQLREEQRQIREIELELPTYERKVQNLERKHTDISGDPYVNTEDKEAITSEMRDLKAHWLIFTDTLTGKKDRLNVKIQDNERKMSDDLSGYRSLLENVIHWIDRKEVELDDLDPVSDDPKVIETQREELRLFTKGVLEYKGTFSTATEGAYELIKDPVITPDEKLTLQKETHYCVERWDNLNDKIKLRTDSILAKTQDHLNKQKGLLGDWKDKSRKFEKAMKKSEDRLKDQVFTEKEIGLELMTRRKLPSDVIHRAEQNEQIEWQHSVDEANDELRSKRERLQVILEEKKNRKWSILMALKDVMASIGSRFRRDSKTGLNLEKLVEQMQKHEVLMDDVASLQPPADDVMSVGDQALRSGLLDVEQTKKIHDGMHGLNGRWNTLNIDVIEKEMRLVGLSDEVEDQYTLFEDWRVKADLINDKLVQFEDQVKLEDKIGTDIAFIKLQLADNEILVRDAKTCEPMKDSFLTDSKELIDGGQLDKADVDGVAKTTNTLAQRWNAVTKHLDERQEKLEDTLRDLEEAERRKEEERRRQQEEEEKRREEEERREREEAERKRKEDEADAAIVMPEPVVELVQQDAQVYSAPDDFFSSFDNESRERVNEWREDCNDVDKWLTKHEPKLKEEPDDEDLSGLKEQLREMKVVEKDLSIYEPRYLHVEQKYSEIVEEPCLDEEEKKTVTDEMNLLKDHWYNVTATINAKRERLENKIKEEERKKANAVVGFRDQLRDAKDWIELRNGELEEVGPASDDLKTALQQKEKLKDLSKRIADYEPSFNDTTDGVYKLMKDPVITPDEKMTLQTEVQDCEDRWDTLNDKMQQRVDRILSETQDLQKKQKGLLDNWKIRSNKFERSLKASEDKLKDQVLAEKEIGLDFPSRPEVSVELKVKANEHERITWPSSVDEANERLRRERENLQVILQAKKNRKWTILEAFKDVMASIGSRFRRGAKPGVNLEKLVEQMINHEELMADVSTKQPPADDVMSVGDQAVQSGLLDAEQTKNIDDKLFELNDRWNTLNIDAIEKEMRLEQLAWDIKEEYTNFDEWQTNCENVNQFFVESERLIKTEEKIGEDIEKVKEQIEDNNDFMNEVNAYTGQVNLLFDNSKPLVNGGRLDKTDVDGIEKTTSALSQRWSSVNDHLTERKKRLEKKLKDLEEAKLDKLDEEKRQEQEEEERRRREQERKENEERVKGEAAGRELLINWRNDLNDVNVWMKKGEPKLQQEADDLDLIALKQQQKQIRKIEVELPTYDRKVENLEEKCSEMADDPYVGEDDKQEVTSKLEDLKPRWRIFKDTLIAKRDRLNDKIQDRERKTSDDLSMSHSRLVDVKHWIEVKEGEVDAFDAVSDDPQTIHAQRKELKEFTKVVMDYEPTLNSAVRETYDLIKDPVITPDEKLTLQTEAHDCEERWDSLSDKIKLRVDSILLKTQDQQKKQKGLLDQWKDRANKFDKSLRKSEDRLKDQVASEKEIGVELATRPEVSPDVKERANQDETITWSPSVDEAYERLRRERERLQVILNEKKNRKWSILEALKDVVASISSRFRRGAKPGVNLEKLVEQMINHEGLMANVAAKQPSADDVMLVGDQALHSGLLDAEQTKKIHDGMHGLNGRWNTLNIDVIEKEMRLERLAHGIQEEYSKFDDWRVKAENVNQDLVQFESHIKSEDKIGTDVHFIKLQLADNEKILNDVKECEPTVESLSADSKVLVDGGHLDQADINGVEKTTTALSQRWDAVNKHLNERQDKLEATLAALEEEEMRREEEKRKELEEEEQRRREEEEQRRREQDERRRLEDQPDAGIIMPEPVVELVQQDAQVYSAPDDFFSSFDNESRERVKEWREDCNDVDQWLTKHEPKLKEEPDDEDLSGLKEQLREIRLLEKDLSICEPRYNHVEQKYDEIVEEAYLNDDEKKTIEGEMDNLKDHWSTVTMMTRAKRERLERKILEEGKRRANSVADSRDTLRNVRDWIELRNGELEGVGPASDDLKTALEQKEKLKDLSKRISDYEPSFNDATDGVYKLMKDPVITPDEKLTLQTEVQDVEDRWDTLNDKMKQRVDSILSGTEDLQKKRKGLLDNWKIRSNKFERSLKASEDKLKDQVLAEKEIGLDFPSRPEVSVELKGKANEHERITWSPSVDEVNERLKRERKALQEILKDKKNRKWTMLEALKDVMASISSRFRRGAKPGVNLDKLVEQMINHEDVMADVSAKQPPADDIMSVGDQAVQSGLLDAEQTKKIDDKLFELNDRWNALNIDAIEKEMRLERLAVGIEDEYTMFDEWRENCDNVNQFLLESERLIKAEDKIGDSIEEIREQLEDNNDFTREVDAYTEKVNFVFDEGRVLVDGGCMDKTDVEGIEKTSNALSQRWNSVNDHLKERKKRLEQKLQALEKAELDKLDEEKRREQEEERKRKREQDRKENEDRAKGEAAGRELLINWRNDLNDVNMWMKKGEPKLKQEANDLDLISLKQQQKQIRQIELELPTYERKVINLEELHSELVADPHVTEDNKVKVITGMEDLRTRWNIFTMTLAAKRDRLNDKIQDRERKTSDDLSMSRSRLVDVKHWIEVKEAEVDAFDEVSDDPQTIHAQREELKEFSKIVMDYEPTLNSAIGETYDLIKDPVITPDEKLTLQTEAHDCEERWDSLSDKIKLRVESILQKLQDHQKKQKGLLYEWKDKFNKFDKSLRKSEDKLKDQVAAEKEIGVELTDRPEVSSVLKGKAQQHETIAWQPSVEKGNEQLRRERERLQVILKDKKNRKWSILEALKDVVASISSRFRRGAKPGVNLEKLVEQMINHEELMTEVSAKQPPADDVMLVGDQALRSGLLDAEQNKKVHDGMHGLNGRWNTLNIDVIEKEMRLERLAHGIQEEYSKFDDWRVKAENVNQDLVQFESHIKNEDKIGTDVHFIKLQLADNEKILNDVRECEPTVESLSADSNVLVDEGHLDQADINGVEKTTNALSQRCDAVNKHLNERQHELKATLKTLEEDEWRREEQRRREQEEAEERRRREEEEQREKEEDERRRAEDQPDAGIIMPEPVVELVQQDAQVYCAPDDFFSSFDNESRERVKEWREDCNDVDKEISKYDPKLRGEYGDGNTTKLREQLRETKEIEKDLAIFEPRYLHVEQRYGEISDEPCLNEDEKKTIKNEMDHLKNHWFTVTTRTREKRERLEDKIRDEEKKRANAVVDCRDKMRDVKDWIDIRDKELVAVGPVDVDIKSAKEQKEKLKALSKRVSDYEPTFNGATDEAYRLIKDPMINPEDKMKLQAEAQDCEDRWDSLNDNMKLHVDSILNRSLDLQKKQKGYLDDWRDKSNLFDRYLRTSEDKLNDQVLAEKEIDLKFPSRPEVSAELKGKASQHETITWQSSTEEANERLRREREKLQVILQAKKNRKWTVLEALKDVVASISSRFRRGPKPGVNLEKLVEQMINHEELMAEVASLQSSADDVMTVGDRALRSELLDARQTKKIQDGMHGLNDRWNTLNIDVIEKEMRLERLALKIRGDYAKFEVWRGNSANVNQWLAECERLMKDEKSGDNIETLREQLEDNQAFMDEVKEYEPTVEALFADSKEIIDGEGLDKADIDGVEKTTNALSQRWNAVKKHLNERRERIEATLLEHLRNDADGKFGVWRERSVKLDLSLSHAQRNIEGDLDETDFVSIQENANELQMVEEAIDAEYSPLLNDITDSGMELIRKESLSPENETAVSEALNKLNEKLGEVKGSAKEKKRKLMDATALYFASSLSEREQAVEGLQATVTEKFSVLGSDLSEVEFQMRDMKKFEADIAEEEAKFEELKQLFSASHELVHENDRVRIAERIAGLEVKWQQLRETHLEEKKRLVHALIVLHEELMEEIYDWMSDAEKRAASIVVNETEIQSVKTNYGKLKELKHDIASFEPNFNKGIELSNRFVSEKLADPERVESYTNEVNSLEDRWTQLQNTQKRNGSRLAGALGGYMTTRLDDAEIALTNAESLLKEKEDSNDVKAAKQRLDAYRVTMKEINTTQQSVDEILCETKEILDEGHFSELEQDHFGGRIEAMQKRNNVLESNAAMKEKRLFERCIILFKQQLARMNNWLTKAEKRMKTIDERGINFDHIKKQLEENQLFQEDLRDHSMISLILELDITGPGIDKDIQLQVKSISERWSALWNWSEHRKLLLLQLLKNWQKFREEQLVLLNWLSTKEKLLKDIGKPDLSDDNEMKEHLELLRAIETELEEQGIRLQALHKAGDELLVNVDPHDPAAVEIRKQLDDFDDCWNGVAKQVIDRIQLLDSSQNKLKELHAEMVVVNEWMDDASQLMTSFDVLMEPEDATKLQEKIEIKCEERPKYATRVERINRLGRSLIDAVDENSNDTIQEELFPFNKRWSEVSEQLDSFSDKGYAQLDKGDCCIIRVMKNKLGIFE